MSKKAEYKAFPELSPYLNDDRYRNPKEDHKFILEELKSIYASDSIKNVCDVGCGNGDLLYLLKQNFVNWNLAGYDYTKEFIDYARKFDGLKDVKLFHKDLFKIEEKYDIVLADGITHIFPDIEKTLNKYLEICNKGGHILTTGRFNKYDIEVRLQYCDNSNPETKGIWREDWCQHSRSLILELFQDKVDKIKFIDVIMDKEIKQNQNTPINQWTFRNSEGKNIITNGTNVILNKTLLVIKK
tara:strand:- start:7061 stop:7786 length:726 start_codon:yes stop_codon:yes gene_type:complete